MRPVCGQCAASVLPTCSCSFFFYLSYWLVRVCEIELSHMGKNNRNPHLVCEKFLIFILRGPEELSHPNIVLVNNQLCVSMIEFRERILNEVYYTDIHV